MERNMDARQTVLEACAIPDVPCLTVRRMMKREPDVFRETVQCLCADGLLERVEAAPGNYCLTQEGKKLLDKLHFLEKALAVPR